MYQKASIERLSPAQISRMLNGHRVRVKHGKGQAIHLSPEQNKKLMNASKKGCGITIQLDPYSMDLNKKLKGQGWMDTAFKVAKSVGEKVAPVLIDAGSNALKSYIEKSGEEQSGSGMKRGRPQKGVQPIQLRKTASMKVSKSKGGALRPAGYGASGEGYIGAELGRFIGSEFIPF